MKLSPEERETIILYLEADDNASVYTHDKKLSEKLKRLSKKYPDKIYVERREHPGAVSYIVPKSCVSIREPYSDARRKAASERAKKAGIVPPNRSISSKSE